jgi:hypothetical protein
MFTDGIIYDTAVTSGSIKEEFFKFIFLGELRLYIYFAIGTLHLSGCLTK